MIEQGDGGDLIDCVDIYKQPALNHPLLKNHTIQVSSYSLIYDKFRDYERVIMRACMCRCANACMWCVMLHAPDLVINRKYCSMIDFDILLFLIRKNS